MYHVAVNSAGMQDQDGRLLAETEPSALTLLKSRPLKLEMIASIGKNGTARQAIKTNQCILIMPAGLVY